MAKTFSEIQVRLNGNIAGLTSALNKASGDLNKFSKNISNVGKQAIAGFGVYEIVSGVVEATSQFQKFEAVLTNTLGSKSAAQKALSNITEFAKTSPYQVEEVTAAYVRWANQGLNPTISRMQKLSDIASSLGAGFEQTAEAFKDLAVGQTKRIEEIGISAQSSGEKIKLSFRGVNIEVKKNAEGVQRALDVYSQLNGVLGTSDQISQTLGGRISNLKDSWQIFLKTLGEGNKGILFGIVESLTALVNATTNWRNELALIRQAISPITSLKDVTKETLDYLLKFGRTDTGKKVADVLKPLNELKTAEFFANDPQGIARQKQFTDLLLKEGEEIEDINVLWKYYVAQKRLSAFENGKLTRAEQAATEAALNRTKAEEIKTLELQRQQEEYDRLIEKIKNYDKIINRFEDRISPIKQTRAYDFTGAEQMTTAQFGGNQFANQIDALTTKAAAFVAQQNKLRDSIAQVNNAFQDAASQGIQNFLVGLGDVAAGSVSFGDNFIRAISLFMKQFGSSLIAIGIGKLSLDTLFKGPLGGPLAIAAGTALVAGAGFISKQMDRNLSRVGSGWGGSGSMSGSSGFNYGAMNQNQNINVTGKLVGSGRDLVAILYNTNIDNGYRKGG